MSLCFAFEYQKLLAMSAARDGSKTKVFDGHLQTGLSTRRFSMVRLFVFFCLMFLGCDGMTRIDAYCAGRIVFIATDANKFILQCSRPNEMAVLYNHLAAVPSGKTVLFVRNGDWVQYGETMGVSIEFSGERPGRATLCGNHR